MAGDNLDLRAVLSIFKQSSSIEDFEKRLNSADTKVNNIDLNNDNRVDYLRVVDYGKDDFHSIVIQDPVSKAESQDVAVIEIVKKGNNTAHIQIVGDETLYGKDYIIEPDDQAPLNSGTSTKSNNNNNNNVNDDVYADPNTNATTTTSRVMINVWAWPSIGYLYGPGYSYYASPYYYGYYPGWYSPWTPYGYYAYHRGFYGYNYGFYGYRRYHHAFPHVHNYYYGKRVSSGYVQKNAPRYNGRRDNHNNNTGHKETQPRTTGRSVDRTNTRTNSDNRTRGNVQNNKVQSGTKTKGNTTRSPNNTTRNNQRSTSQPNPQRNSGNKVNSSPNKGNSGRVNSGGGGSRANSGGGGSRSSGGGGSRGGGRK